MCGDCHCIPDHSSDCPLWNETLPSPETIERFRHLVLLNPIGLDCNPYYTCLQNITQQQHPAAACSCETSPPQRKSLVALGEAAVCALHFIMPMTFPSMEEETAHLETELLLEHQQQQRQQRKNTPILAKQQPMEQSSCPTQYRLESYASRAEAEQNGAHMTHAGVCGACSSTQDLAVYLRHEDMERLGSWCTAQAIVSEELGMECYRNVGMTNECAKIWVYNGLDTRNHCWNICALAKMEQWDNNGPPPQCQLNDCLQCDETVSGPLFQTFAGRTRRRSGLLSHIVRPCTSLQHNIPHDPCPPPTTRTTWYSLEQ